MSFCTASMSVQQCAHGFVHVVDEFGWQDSAAVLGLFNAFRDESCLETASDPAHCDNLFTLLSHISTPLFIAQNLYDSNQIFLLMQTPQTPTLQVSQGLPRMKSSELGEDTMSRVMTPHRARCHH